MSRFVGLDLSRQIPNWLYDVVAIEGMRGPFVAGNHSATEIQAVALESQLQRVDAIIAHRRTAAQDAQSPACRSARTCEARPWTTAQRGARITSTCCRSTRRPSAPTSRT